MFYFLVNSIVRELAGDYEAYFLSLKRFDIGFCRGWPVDTNFVCRQRVVGFIRAQTKIFR